MDKYKILKADSVIELESMVNKMDGYILAGGMQSYISGGPVFIQAMAKAPLLSLSEPASKTTKESRGDDETLKNLLSEIEALKSEINKLKNESSYKKKNTKKSASPKARATKRSGAQSFTLSHKEMTEP